MPFSGWVRPGLCIAVFCGLLGASMGCDPAPGEPPPLIANKPAVKIPAVGMDTVGQAQRFLATGDESALRGLSGGGNEQPSEYPTFADMAHIVLRDPVPLSPFTRCRAGFFLRNRDRAAVVLQEVLERNGVSVPRRVTVPDWSPSELYSEGLLKLARGVLVGDEEVDEAVEPLNLDPGEAVADIGFGDGQFLAEMAAIVGESGQAIGVEIAPSLVDFVNDQADCLNLPQMSAVLGADQDITLPEKSLDAALVRFVFSNLRDEVQPWVDSIYRAMKPGGRVVIFQHYSPVLMREKRAMIDAFLGGTGPFQCADTFPCELRGPEVVRGHCERAGFQFVRVADARPQDGLPVYCLVVRKP